MTIVLEDVTFLTTGQVHYEQHSCMRYKNVFFMSSSRIDLNPINGTEFYIPALINCFMDLSNFLAGRPNNLAGSYLATYSYEIKHDSSR